MTDSTQAPASSPRVVQRAPLDPALFLSLAPETSRLFSAMNPILVAGQGLTVQFIGANTDEGVSTIARDFALTAAQYVEGLVLLLDFDWGRDSHFTHFQQALKPHGKDLHLEQPLNLEIDLNPLLRFPDQSGASSTFKFYRLPETQLVLGRQDSGSGDQPEVTPCILNRPDIWAMLRRQFMLTVVDSPPANHSFEGVAFSGAMDAVVIVVRAEFTRTPVVENLRDRLIAQGAPLAGIVLNQRRFYIPKFIYHILDRL